MHMNVCFFSQKSLDLTSQVKVTYTCMHAYNFISLALATESSHFSVYLHSKLLQDIHMYICMYVYIYICI